MQSLGFQRSIKWSSLIAFFMAMVVAVPALSVARSVFDFNPELWHHLSTTVLPEYLYNTFMIAALVVTATAVIGVCTAWVTVRYHFPGKSVFEWALLLPLAMPGYIIAFTYTGLLEFDGPVQTLLRDTFNWRYGDYWFPDIRNLFGASAMLSLVLYPYVYLLARSAFLAQSSVAMEAARSLGCSQRQAIVQVAIPMARPAIVTGLSLVMMECLAEFGTMEFFGVQTFTTGIFRTWFGLYDSSGASQLATLLLLLVMMLVMLERHSRASAHYHNTNAGHTAEPVRLRGGRALIAFLLCFFPLALGFLLPLSRLLWWTISELELLTSPAFLLLLFHSAELALLAALLCLPPAIFLAYVLRGGCGPWVKGMIRLSAMGYAIPGTVIAVGILDPAAWFDHRVDQLMVAGFNHSTGLLLSGSIAILLFAYLVRFFTVTLNTVEAGLGQIKPSQDEAARNLGLSPWQTLIKIHLPLAKGSLLTAVIIVFVDVLKELPATLVLRPFNFNTLAVSVFEFASDERLAEAAPGAVTIVLIGILPVYLLSQSIRKTRT